MRARAQLGVGLAIGLLASASVAVVAGARSRPDPRLPGPTTAARADARLDRNDACEGCHADIAEEWRGSLHRDAYTDPMVQAALAGGEQRPEFCRGCHAPEADPERAPDARRAAIGVGCVGCHLIGDSDEVLAAPRGLGATGLEPAPHPVRRESSFAEAEACGGCHEFWFPAAGRAGHELIMQRTLAEHRRSPTRAQPCQSCHMPERGGEDGSHRSHGFHVVGDLALLRSAATITASRELADAGQSRVEIRLEPKAVGHAFPTGDLFRRLVVQIDPEVPDDRCVTQRYLARRFGLERVAPGSVIRVEVEDDRVQPGPGARVVEWTLPSPCTGQSLRWSVAYERVLDTPIGDEQAATVWDRTELASGVLAPVAN